MLRIRSDPHFFRLRYPYFQNWLDPDPDPTAIYFYLPTIGWKCLQIWCLLNWTLFKRFNKKEENLTRKRFFLEVRSISAFFLYIGSECAIYLEVGSGPANLGPPPPPPSFIVWAHLSARHNFIWRRRRSNISWKCVCNIELNHCLGLDRERLDWRDRNRTIRFTDIR